MAAKRRAYGTGTITDLGNGRWKLIVSLGTDPLTGARRRPTKVVHATSRTDAQRQLNSWHAELVDHRVDRSNVTLGQLLDAYFAARPGMSPTTAAESARAVARYLPEHLARQPLKRIGVYELDSLYRHLEAAGGVCRRRKNRCDTIPCEHGGGAPLAAATVIRFHHDIHAALEQARRWQWITTNPADLVTLSDVDEAEIDVDPDEVLPLLAHLHDLPRDTAETGFGRRRDAGGRLLPKQAGDPSPLPAFVDLLLATGARPGEVCAFTYGQLDLDRHVGDEARPQVKIDASIARGRGGATRKQTKTKKARRVVLDAYTVDVVRRRRTDWLPAALAAGIPLDDLHVFPSSTDILKPIRPDVIGRLFAQARADAGVSNAITMRNLRHLVASLLAEAGVHPTTIAGRLGHSAVVLLNRYAHILDPGNAAAAGIVNKRLGRSG